MLKQTLITLVMPKLKGKLIWLFILFTLFPFLWIGYYGYYSTTQSLLKNVLTTDKQQVENTVKNIEDILVAIPNDLHFLTHFYALQRFLQWRAIGEPYKTKQWLGDTRQAFDSFISHQKVYRQLQVIDTQGQELLRIDYDQLSDRSTVANYEQLHNRKHFEYVTSTLALKGGEIHLTRLQPYNEQDINDKYQNVIRYSTPIIDDNQVTQGILVLTVYARTFMQLLNEENQRGWKNKSFYYSLIDSQGDYLYQPAKHPKWNKIESQYDNFMRQAPDFFQTMMRQPQGSRLNQNILTTYKRIYPLPTQPTFWIVIKQTSADTALTQLNNYKKIFWTAFGLIILLVFFLTAWFTKKLITPLLQVNEHLKALALGQVIVEPIDFNQNDEIGELVISTMQLKTSIHSTIAQANAIAQGNYNNEIKLLSSQDQLGRALCHMTQTLHQATQKMQQQDWLKTAQTQLHDKMSGEQALVELGQNIIRFLTPKLEAQIGLLYLVTDEKPHQPTTYLKLLASYAHDSPTHFSQEFALGEGLVGQAALERKSILITNVPANYIQIQSGLGEAPPHQILLTPFLYENSLKGVIEIGTFQIFTEIQQEFLRQIMPSIGIAIHSAQSRSQLEELLQQTQMMTEELQSQQEELRQTNEELEQRTQDLEQQQEEIKQKNSALEKAQAAAETKAKELELASRYKSEFLANMSHELRTPLNSLLILAQLLADNKEGNLSSKQMEYAKTIHSAGSDLLLLINDILDLSKVEAGKIEISCQEISLPNLLTNIEQKFQPLAHSKKLTFTISTPPTIPDTLNTDSQRLKQILNNLLSNAIKFTSQGQVSLEIDWATPAELAQIFPANAPPTPHFLAFKISDTGIGIPEDKKAIIFEAFQQADGTTSRRFGGTGLGLSISRQLSRLLGGDILLTSEINQGSSFTLYLPSIDASQPKETKKQITKETAPQTTPLQTVALIEQTPTQEKNIEPEIEKKEVKKEIEINQQPVQDDRTQIAPNDKIILIIEDDRKFATILIELTREKGFKCLLAEDGKTGLQLAEQYQPHAIILDISLPQVDGWTVMERLKDNPQTRHIPVHFMSASDHSHEAKKMGAIGYLLKPVNMAELGEAFKKIEQFIANTVKHLLIVADENSSQKQKVLELVASKEIQASQANNKTQALQQLQQTAFDCIILDMEVENDTGIQLLEQLHQKEHLSQIPVIIYAERELSTKEEEVLQKYSDNLIVKAVQSPARLLDEATLFLHQVEAKLPTEKRNMIRMMHDKSALLREKKVLIVDDDMRNTFALATALEDKEMEVIVAKTGKEALERLAQHPDTDIILMDIMMPEMDGYQAMQTIRTQPQHHKLPMIALTAKAMKGDKAKCIEAGANDYLSKPIDTDKLISLMKVWLYR
jgi:signal transduction histidine kinase/CheY-like chemotaxis protein/cell division protein FtsB